jgi:hypothetical protein
LRATWAIAANVRADGPKDVLISSKSLIAAALLFASASFALRLPVGFRV